MIDKDSRIEFAEFQGDGYQTLEEQKVYEVIFRIDCNAHHTISKRKNHNPIT